MCRWLAYSGSSLPLEELLYKPANSLVVQSLHSRLGAETTNGDGFGVGWYADPGLPTPTTPAPTTPGLFRSTEPAWNDRNLRDLAAHVRSPLMFAHIRASSGSAVQQTNCHPFRHGRWLWMHNGMVSGFPQVHRDLAMAVDPELFARIEGSTDSELLFFLALTFGLQSDPPAAVARAVGVVEEALRRRGVDGGVQMTVATTDGERVWAFRYSSAGPARSLFHSADVATLRHQYPENPALHELSDDTRIVVSEPLGDLRGAWREVPEDTCVSIGGGREALSPFAPTLPRRTAGSTAGSRG
jgi:glutamine amidotransferase